MSRTITITSTKSKNIENNKSDMERYDDELKKMVGCDFGKCKVL
jgi:hypothetical protein